MRLADAHRRAQIRRLHKDRVLERRLDLRDGLARRALPLRPQQRDVLHDGQPGLGKEPLHHVLVHARRRAQHARADIGDPRQLEEPLDRSILAKGSVQHGKDHVQRLAAQRRVAVQSRRAAVNQRGSRRIVRLRSQQRGLSLGQHPRSRRSRRIARPQLLWFWTGLIAAAQGHPVALQQPLRRPEVSQCPALLIPIGTTSNFRRSIAFKIEAAESSETSCSPLRPPKRIPTRSFFAILFFDHRFKSHKISTDSV